MYLHPPSKQLAPPAPPPPRAFPHLQLLDLQECAEVNLSEMATIVLDSDLIPKKPNNRKHFEHLSCAPVVHILKLR